MQGLEVGYNHHHRNTSIDPASSIGYLLAILTLEGLGPISGQLHGSCKTGNRYISLCSKREALVIRLATVEWEHSIVVLHAEEACAIGCQLPTCTLLYFRQQDCS